MSVIDAPRIGLAPCPWGVQNSGLQPVVCGVCVCVCVCVCMYSVGAGMGILVDMRRISEGQVPGDC